MLPTPSRAPHQQLAVYLALVKYGGRINSALIGDLTQRHEHQILSVFLSLNANCFASAPARSESEHLPSKLEPQMPHEADVYLPRLKSLKSCPSCFSILSSLSSLLLYPDATGESKRFSDKTKNTAIHEPHPGICQPPASRRVVYAQRTQIFHFLLSDGCHSNSDEREQQPKGRAHVPAQRLGRWLKWGQRLLWQLSLEQN